MDIGKAELAVEVCIVGDRVVQAHVPAGVVVNAQRQVTVRYLGVFEAATGPQLGVKQIGYVATHHQCSACAPGGFLGVFTDGAVVVGGCQQPDVVFVGPWRFLGQGGLGCEEQGRDKRTDERRSHNLVHCYRAS